MALADTAAERKALKFVGGFPVLLCLGIVGWSYYAFIFTVCGPLLATHTVQALSYIVMYHPLFVLFMWSYVQVVLVHPGTPPRQGTGRQRGAQSSVPQRISDHHHIQAGGIGAEIAGAELPLFGSAGVGSPAVAGPSSLEAEVDGRSADVRLSLEMIELSVTVKRNGQQRFCTKCNMEKPDRAHHCRMCGQCILKMDHHCPWINSCVGFRNQKHFILFISWGALYCLFVAITTVERTVEVLTEDLTSVDVQWALLILFGVLFGISLLAFAGYHIHMVISNLTTIETFQRHTYRSSGGLGPSGRLNLFDLGKRKNWIQVMGEPWYLWFLPISNTPGDGMIWPLSTENYSVLGVGLGDRSLA